MNRPVTLAVLGPWTAAIRGELQVVFLTAHRKSVEVAEKVLGD